jgi:hypothetical protein
MNLGRYTSHSTFIAVGLAVPFFGVAWYYRSASHAMGRELALVKLQHANLTSNVKATQIRLDDAQAERGKQHVALRALQVQSTSPKKTPAASPRIVQRPMANASASYQRGGTALAGEIDWDAVDAQARTFLSPVQFALFTTMEPPLPIGARFQSQLYREVDNMKKREPAAKLIH